MTVEAGTVLATKAWRIHQTADEHGFWPEGGRNFGEMLALAASELSEALEEHRHGQPWFYLVNVDDEKDQWLNITPQEYINWSAEERSQWKPEGVMVELADCLIRLLDTMYGLTQNKVQGQGAFNGRPNGEIDRIMLAKQMFNDTREHKHGRAY